jgi:hypothetical protein
MVQGEEYCCRDIKSVGWVTEEKTRATVGGWGEGRGREGYGEVKTRSANGQRDAFVTVWR